MSILFGAFLVVTLLISFDAFLRLEGNATHINAIGTQRERVYDSKFQLLSYVDSNDKNEKRELLHDMEFFKFTRSRLLPKEQVLDEKGEQVNFTINKEFEKSAHDKTTIDSILEIKPIAVKKIVDHVRSSYGSWAEFEKEINGAINLHEKIISLLAVSNEKMVSALSAKKILAQRLAEVENKDYVHYDRVMDEIRSQILRAKTYLDGYTAVSNVDMVADYLLNFDVAVNKIRDYVEGIRSGSDKYDILPLLENDTESIALVTELLDKTESYETTLRETIEVRDKLTESIKKIDTLGRKVIDDLNVTGNMLSEYSENRISTKKGIDLLLLFIGFVVIGTLVLISRSISRPIDKIVNMIQLMSKGHIKQRLNLNRSDEIGVMAKAMDDFSDSLQTQFVGSLQKLSQGDLSFSVTSKDPDDLIGVSLVKARENLNDLMSIIHDTADNIASGATEISNASQSLSEGAADQAGSIEEINSSITEIGERASENAQKASTAARISELACGAAKNGNEQMMNMLNAMGEINEASTSIQKIIKVIDEIAFQTNLLALNAAVEAARAGKHGKGFAVVAQEVRKLAGRSANAAKETANLIEQSVKKTGKGMEISNRTAEALGEIEQGITQVTDIVNEIASASEGQASGIKHIKEGVNQIEKVTQQNTTNAAEGASISKDLAAQAMLLKRMLSRFKLKSRQPSIGAVPDKGKTTAGKFPAVRQ
jgi:methyl-accepting chemotaxis protein